MLKFSGIFVVLFLTLQSCRKDNVIPDNIKTYLHIGHPRLDINPGMDSVIEAIDYLGYDMLLLGGDLAYLTSLDEPTMNHIDSIFDLGSLNTLWALGNHDYSNVELVSEYTGREPYYAYYQNGITFLVLDTQDSVSQVIGDQLNFVKSVLDTLSHSHHLVLLHHQLIWLSGDAALESVANSVSNGPLGTCSYCIHDNNFYTDVYPKLVGIRQNGTTVICIGGDIGSKAKLFEHYTEDNIVFLGSGIKAETEGNLGLVFSHNLTSGALTWEFQPVESL